jgi:hypothetical protein
LEAVVGKAIAMTDDDLRGILRALQHPHGSCLSVTHSEREYPYIVLRANDHKTMGHSFAATLAEAEARAIVNRAAGYASVVHDRRLGDAPWLPGDFQPSSPGDPTLDTLA